MDLFHDKNMLCIFVLKLVDHLCPVQGGGGGRGCEGGKGRGFVKCNMLCLYVCYMKENLKKY